MTQGKHTPGPWAVAFEEGTKVKDAGKNTVAWLQQTHLRGKRSEEEVAANARLIAAAPEMLEALRDALGTIRSASRALSEEHKLVLGGKPWGGRDIVAIEAVIAKAEGR